MPNKNSLSTSRTVAKVLPLETDAKIYRLSECPILINGDRWLVSSR